MQASTLQQCMTVHQVLSLAATALSTLSCVKGFQWSIFSGDAQSCTAGVLCQSLWRRLICIQHSFQKTHTQCPGVTVFDLVNLGYAGAMADELQKQAADETASLRPPHSYVPWITVNGIALGGASEQLQTFICAAYLGDRYDHAL